MKNKRIASKILAALILINSITPNINIFAYGSEPQPVLYEPDIETGLLYDSQGNLFEPYDLNPYLTEREDLYIPSYYDIRDHYRIPVPDNQLTTPLCGLFATISAYQLSGIVHGMWGEEVNFSEAQVDYFSLIPSEDINDPLYGKALEREEGITSNFGRSMNFGSATGILERGTGPITQKEKWRLDVEPEYLDFEFDESYRYQTEARIYETKKLDFKDPDSIKQAILENGAVYFVYNHDSSDGLYNKQTDAYYRPAGFIGNQGEKDDKYINHAANIIGWDDNYSKSNFNSANIPPTDGAWIIRNSWGVGAHNEGYFYMSYCQPELNDPNIIVPCEYEDYGRTMYQYDGLGKAVIAWGSTINSLEYSCIYTASTDDPAAAIQLMTNNYNAEYEIQIRKGTSLTDPLSGTTVYTQKGSLDNPGLHTIDLDEAVPLSENENFSVTVVTTDTSLGVEKRSEKNNPCFFRVKGSNTWRTSYDFCLKVLTAPTDVPTSLTVTEGDKYIDLKWDAVPNASGYNIYSYVRGKYTYLTSSSTNSCRINNLVNGNDYFYAVTFIRNGIESDYSNFKDGTPKSKSSLAAPANICAEYNGNRILLKWDTVDDAQKYEIYYFKNGIYSFIDSVTKNYSIIRLLHNNPVNSFAVKAVYDDGVSDYSEIKMVDSTAASAPTALPSYILFPEDKSVTIKFAKDPNISHYYFYSESGKYLGSSAFDTFTFNDLPNNEPVKITVKAQNSAGYFKKDIEVTASPLKKGKPSGITFSNETADSITVKCEFDDDALGCFIYLYNSENKIEQYVWISKDTLEKTFTGLTPYEEYWASSENYYEGAIYSGKTAPKYIRSYTWEPYTHVYSQDTSVSVPFGVTGRISASFRGRGKMTYEWFCKSSASGTAIPVSSLKGFEIENDGWTSTLIINDTAAYDGYYFYCKATDEAGYSGNCKDIPFSVVPRNQVTGKMVLAMDESQLISYVNAFLAESDGVLILSDAELMAIELVLENDYAA